MEGTTRGWYSSYQSLNSIDFLRAQALFLQILLSILQHGFFLRKAQINHHNNCWKVQILEVNFEIKLWQRLVWDYCQQSDHWKGKNPDQEFQRNECTDGSEQELHLSASESSNEALLGKVFDTVQQWTHQIPLLWEDQGRLFEVLNASWGDHTNCSRGTLRVKEGKVLWYAWDVYGLRQFYPVHVTNHYVVCGAENALTTPHLGI